MTLIQATFADGSTIVRTTVNSTLRFGWRATTEDGATVAEGFISVLQVSQLAYVTMLNGTARRLEIVTVGDAPMAWRIRRSHDQGKTWRFCRFNGKAHSRYNTAEEAEDVARIMRKKSAALYEVTNETFR